MNFMILSSRCFQRGMFFGAKGLQFVVYPMSVFSKAYLVQDMAYYQALGTQSEHALTANIKEKRVLSRAIVKAEEIEFLFSARKPFSLYMQCS